jgi:hypothetical protein
MKNILIIILFSFYFKNNPVYIEGKGYRGYIFLKSYTNKYFPREEEKCFTPKKNDVEIAEAILKKKIACDSKKQIRLSRECPVIHRNLAKYNRQYFGEIDKNGSKIIYINFIWQKATPDYWDKDIVIKLDGCSFFWNVKVNIDSGEMYDLNVNGMG